MIQEHINDDLEPTTYIVVVLIKHLVNKEVVRGRTAGLPSKWISEAIVEESFALQ